MSAATGTGPPGIGADAGWSRGLLIDRLAIGYLAATGLLALAFGGALGAGIAALHALGVLGILRLRRWRPRRGPLGFVRMAYPLALAPALYAELAVLNRFLTPRFFDGLAQEWDAALFGGQPSMELSALWPWLPVSEVLHLGYFLYYAIIPAALLGVFRTRGFDAAHRVACAAALAFFVSYFIFTLFPVAGPRYEFERIGGGIADGTMYGIVHGILEGGSSKGTAFPSSHIAASLAAVLAAGREDARWLCVLAAPEVALALGTVYGRFHYGVDAVAGVALGVAACALVPGPGGRLGWRRATRRRAAASEGATRASPGTEPREESGTEWKSAT